MNPIVFAIPVFLLTILLEAWLAHRRGLAVYDVPDAVTSMQMGVLSQVAGVFTTFATLGIYTVVHERVAPWTWPIDSPWAWLAALLVYDLCYYGFHRASHEVGILWAAHVVHHSSERYNLSTALRQSSTTALLGWLFYLPMAVLGVPPLMFLVVGLIDLLYQYWVHTQLVGRLGVLDRILVTPSNHRVHHGQNDWCLDRNYGGILIVWDRLFGTFADERDDEPIVYGVRTPLASYDPVWGNLHHYAALARAASRSGGPLAALRVLLASPSAVGRDAGPQPSSTDVSPTLPAAPRFDPSTVVRWAPPVPRAHRAYAAVQFAFAVPLVVHFLAVVPGLSTPAAAGYAALLVLQAFTVGAWLQGRRWARAVEFVRLPAMALGAAAAGQWFGVPLPPAARVAVLVMAAACAAWLLRDARGLPLSHGSRPA